eukprot:2547160-Prymnesium_polylepis.1
MVLRLSDPSTTIESSVVTRALSLLLDHFAVLHLVLFDHEAVVGDRPEGDDGRERRAERAQLRLLLLLHFSHHGLRVLAKG